MEKQTLFTRILGFTVVALLLGGCGVNIVLGSGRVTTQTRDVSNFDSVVLSGAGDLTITQGDSEALTLEAEDNLMPYLKTEVKGGTLVLSVDNGNGRTQVTPTKGIRYNLSAKNVKSIELSGAGRVTSANLKGDQMSIGISGAGSIDIAHLEATSLSSKLSGAGNLKLAGQVTGQTITLSGLGSYDAADLGSKSTQVVVSGAGGATVWANETLDVTINGAGGVKYYGSPQVQKKISGVGGITGLGNK